jgi:hypothetical protein
VTTTTLNPGSSEYTEADREALAQVLRDPLLSTAINTAIREAQPEARNITKLSPEEQAAVANQLAGMSELVMRLKKLSAPLPQINPDEDISGLGEWNHIEGSDKQ